MPSAWKPKSAAFSPDLALLILMPVSCADARAAPFSHTEILIMSRTLLVTGGAGFIGGNFVLRQIAAGDRIINLDALTYAGNRDTLTSVQANPAHTFVEGSIADRALLDRLLREHQPAAIINFAAESHVDRSIDGPAAFVQTNVVGTLALLESARDYWRSLDGEAREAFRFLHVSTDEVYGSLANKASSPSNRHINPTRPTRPRRRRPTIWFAPSTTPTACRR
jgi:dTDP-glucose 4,6-dehydratase